jgi:hypothetical protein
VFQNSGITYQTTQCHNQADSNIVSRTALFWVITRPGSGNLLPTFWDNLSILSSRDRSRNVRKKLPLLGRVITQKSAVLICFTSEGLNCLLPTLVFSRSSSGRNMLHLLIILSQRRLVSIPHAFWRVFGFYFRKK